MFLHSNGSRCDGSSLNTTFLLPPQDGAPGATPSAIRYTPSPCSYKMTVILSSPPAAFALSTNTDANCRIEPSEPTTAAITSSGNASHKPSEQSSTRSPCFRVTAVWDGSPPDCLARPIPRVTLPLSGWERACSGVNNPVITSFSQTQE